MIMPPLDKDSYVFTPVAATASTAWDDDWFFTITNFEFERTEPWEDERGLLHYPRAWFSRPADSTQGGEA